MLKRVNGEMSSVSSSAISSTSRPASLTPSRGGGSKTTVALGMLLIMSVAGFVWSYIKYNDYKSKVARLSTPEGQQEMVKKQTAELVNKVKRHIVLPANEEPTVATILDAVGLAKDQPFYKGAKNGDKVLIYVKAQKALIYNEKEDLLVNVGPVFIENKGQTTANSVPAMRQLPASTGQGSTSTEE